MSQNVVTCWCEAVWAHAAVVSVFVCSLSIWRESHDDVAWFDMVLNDFGAFHPCGDGAVDDYGSHQVADVSGFSTCEVDAYAKWTQLCKEFLCAVDDCGNHFARDEVFVSSDGRGDEHLICGTHAHQVVGVHHHGILSDASPHWQIAGLFPIKVCQRRLCACTVGMHDVAIFVITT